MHRFAHLVFLLACLNAFPQRLSQARFGGSGNDAVSAATTDAAGNIYVGGTTGSFDLPTVQPWQASNRGTRFVVSADSGVTWKPVNNRPIAASIVATNLLVVDPVEPLTFYTASDRTIYRTTDGGQSYSSVSLPVATGGTISALVGDPTSPKTLYAGLSYGSPMWKSIDGGISWRSAAVGLPEQGYVSSLALDSFHLQTLWAWLGSGGYVTTDGGATWKLSPMPWEGGSVSGGGVGYVIDPVTPGVIYGPALVSGRLAFQRSKDGGATWTPVNAPFSGMNLAADPVRAGYIYAVAAGSEVEYSPYFFRSRDFGATWERWKFPSAYPAYGLATDPSNPDILLAGSLRSADGGQTWTRSMSSRSLTAVFSRATKGLVYGTGLPTSDAFVVKYASDAKTVKFATYFGGMGDDGASAVAADNAGNVWIAGVTTSADLPVTPNAAQSALHSDSDLYLARFDANGTLTYCTYLGGNGTETVSGLAVDSAGAVWMTGLALGLDFPGLPNLPATPLAPFRGFVVKIDVDRGLVISKTIGGSNADLPGGITVDAADNVVLTGTSYSMDFPVSGNGVVTGPAPSGGSPRPYLVKLDAAGNTIFSTYFGGSTPIRTATGSVGSQQSGVAVTTDGDGNIYLTGNTAMTDFPTTAGAYQTKVAGGCPWAASAIYTGLIGTIYRYAEDDVFVMKLSGDGTLLKWSTLLGGRCFDRTTSLTVDATGAVIVAGETNSDNFPSYSPLEAPPAAGDYKSFVTVLDPTGSRTAFSSYLTAGSNPIAMVGPGGSVRVAGATGVGAQSSQQVGSITGPPQPNADAVLFNLDLAAPAPAIQFTGMVNGFSFFGGRVAPAEILALSVPNLPPDAVGDVGLAGGAQVSATLAGVQVFFGDLAALVMSVGGGRVFAIAPADLKAGTTVSVKVRVNGVDSNELPYPVVASTPGLLSLNGSGTGAANARNADGTLNSASNPAARGSTITVFLTGGDIGAGTINTGFGMAAVTPLAGFVPGIYAASVTAPNSPGAPIWVDYQQQLTVYLK